MSHSFQYYIHIYCMMSFFCFETDQTEQSQNAMEDSTHPNTSAGETTQVQVSYVSQSDIRMDVVSSFVTQVYQLPLNIGKV